MPCASIGSIEKTIRHIRQLSRNQHISPIRTHTCPPDLKGRFKLGAAIGLPVRGSKMAATFQSPPSQNPHNILYLLHFTTPDLEHQRPPPCYGSQTASPNSPHPTLSAEFFFARRKKSPRKGSTGLGSKAFRTFDPPPPVCGNAALFACCGRCAVALHAVQRVPQRCSQRGAVARADRPIIFAQHFTHR
ncbi:hypothetical protein SAMN04488032_1021, partial [Pacificibacter marinus]|uniref:Uncharacterized protein n=1 Tax=Pacificibacter marinus TaxID=658057 RepID=A0A1Y5RYQ7_9RHOB